VLALPLAVVAKIWIQELLVKDILDHWKTSNQRPWKPALVGISDDSESLSQEIETSSTIAPSTNTPDSVNLSEKN
ncbi:MAG: hypothetical protein AAF959_28710, partial [Cyanobacteria bacterium P01_D01_bin.56]